MADRPDVHVQSLAGDLVVSIAGEVGFPFGVTVTNACERAQRDGLDRLVLDLAGVTFIDSNGITALLQCRKHADAVGMRFELRNASTSVARKLQIIGLQSLLAAE